MQIVSGLTGVNGIASDGKYVYWTESVNSSADDGGLLQTGALRKCFVGGCAGTPIILASDLLAPNFLFVDDENVYVTNNDSVWAIPK